MAHEHQEYRGEMLKSSPICLTFAAVLSLALCLPSLDAQTASESQQSEAPAPSAENATVTVAPPSASSARAFAPAPVQPAPGAVTLNGRFFPPPLTGRERWEKYVKDTYTGWPVYVASLGAALGDHTTNTPKPWGRTWEGYAKRAGTQYASFAIQTSVYQGGSALLGNEGRYVACQCSGGWHRAGYAFQMSFFTYHDREKVLDVPQFAAAYAAGIIPITWYPQGYTVSAQGVQNGTYQLGFVVLVREIQEFAPELKHFFVRFKP